MKEKILSIGLIVLVVCSVFVYAGSTELDQGFEKFGNHSKKMCNCEDSQERNTRMMRERSIENLNLNEDATIEEIRTARGQRHLKRMREKLNLEDSATEEEIKEAMKEKVGEQSFRKHGFNKRRGPQ